MPTAQPAGPPPDPDAAGLIPDGLELPYVPAVADALAGAPLPAGVLDLEHAATDAGGDHR